MQLGVDWYIVTIILVYLFDDEISAITDVIEHLGFIKMKTEKGWSYLNDEFFFTIEKSEEYEGTHELMMGKKD